MRLGIDLGTSNTVAALGFADGTVQPVLFDGAEVLPSAVFLGDDGFLLTGRDALHSARAAPERFEPHPKRCIDDGTVLLGGVEVTVVDLLAAPAAAGGRRGALGPRCRGPIGDADLPGGVGRHTPVDTGGGGTDGGPRAYPSGHRTGGRGRLPSPAVRPGAAGREPAGGVRLRRRHLRRFGGAPHL
ncbi:hypothetical protein Vau01_119530 [Virgisporangium aurantiacum]|uniref:Hsp70 protein n=1 Tax=Virgisporangium aurantiacum TaxID=175570 RepID=A0A8J4EA63_9ACTN|nr:hypothetical protein Vau01_119530 [Virgisporangium aurantiacum]